jgi:hypothetical protein
MIVSISKGGNMGRPLSMKGQISKALRDIAAQLRNSAISPGSRRSLEKRRNELLGTLRQAATAKAEEQEQKQAEAEGEELKEEAFDLDEVDAEEAALAKVQHLSQGQYS